MSRDLRIPGSFRDPSGHLFTRDGVLYRQVNRTYREHYDLLMGSGLYAELLQAGLLIPHTEVAVAPQDAAQAYKVLQPVPVPFVAYPYEWCFSQFRDAARLTLEIHRRALARGMWLKDASAYNVQWFEGRPVLIDTLSFERRPEGRPWVAYRQFCQHFLAPLYLMAGRDARLCRLSALFMDGVPLDLASAMLPFTSRFRLGPLLHLRLHARAIAGLARDYKRAAQRPVSLLSLQALCDSLDGAVRAARFRLADTEWGDYYTGTNYSDQAFTEKRRIVESWIADVAPRQVWDLGANDGTFSRLASDRGISTVAFDVDPVAVEKCYRAARQRQERHLLPLLMDLTIPSPALGWDNTERDAWTTRGQPDLVMALALVHHLAIGNNIPMDRLATFFARVAPRLIVEFPTKADSQVQRMLATREDVFPDYTPEGFETAMFRHYRERARHRIAGAERTLYFLERTGGGGA